MSKLRHKSDIFYSILIDGDRKLRHGQVKEKHKAPLTGDGSHNLD